MGWKLLHKKPILRSRYMVVEQWKMRLPNGKSKAFFVGGGPYDFVMVLAVTPKGELVILKQYYISQGKRIYSLVAGIIGKGESPLATARRELKEETGYAAKRWVALGKSNKGKYSTGIAHHYLALDAEKVGAPDWEGAEDIQVLVISKSKLNKLLKKHGILDVFAEVCARRALARLNKLNRK